MGTARVDATLLPQTTQRRAAIIGRGGAVLDQFIRRVPRREITRELAPGSV